MLPFVLRGGKSGLADGLVGKVLATQCSSEVSMVACLEPRAHEVETDDFWSKLAKNSSGFDSEALLP